MRHWKFPEILWEAISEWMKDDASLLAAALAYYGLFSFVPLLIIILITINFLFMQGFLGVDIAQQAQHFAGQQAPRVAGEMIERATDQATSFRFTLLSVLLLISGAAGLFVQTKRAFHIIWRLPEEKIPFLDLILSYLRSFLLIALVAFLLLATSIFTALLLPVGWQIEELLPVHFGLLRLITNLLSFIFVTLLFAVSYKTLIEVELEWGDVLTGSALAALLFTIGNFFLEIYAGIVDIGSAYGAAGSLVVFLFWIYYSAQIFLFGAEVIKVHIRRK
ncbi:MAG: YihY/virulence factor BrkB family protein [Methanothrix sp.]|jgi:membrane protein|nr:YihY/virulence factor BrkB family protein [Methanothrix sp.]